MTYQRPRWGGVTIDALDVDDLPNTLAEVERLGGQITQERHEYAEGVVHVVTDPEGTELCLVWLRPGHTAV